MSGYLVRGGLVLAMLGAFVGTGCTRTFRGKVVQPNPLSEPTETLRQSEKITIVTGDMELEKPDDPEPTQRASAIHNNRYPLYNQASFTIVSRDRLRFHVQVDHKWQDWADLTTWNVKLVDDQGRNWTPESVEHVRTKIMTTMWDREQRTSICSDAGRDGRGECYNTIGFADDGWRNRQTLGTLSVYRGKADFVFYQRDLFHAGVRSLRLTVSRPGEAFEFTWKFEDTIATTD
jgi:hypothetical protein